ncbi:MAG: glycine zipper domain-containing protein [Verrucomicrobiales bacterium]
MNKTQEPDKNRDPLTGAPGSHPVGTGVGAAGGAAAGAAIGSAAGPVGTVVGAAVGGVVGGLAGKGVAEAIDPTAEDAYWSSNFRREPYYDSGLTYDDYAPAYRLGYENYPRYRGRRFDDVESDLERSWDKTKGNSRLAWHKAKSASRAAWDRLERAIPGDADRDGK